MYKMTKLTQIASAIALASMIASPAFAVPASKFSAHLSEIQLIASGDVTATAAESGQKVAVSHLADILNTTIRTANKKDVLIGVSLQVGLYTDTQVKGKNGSSEQADAMGGVKVTVLVDGKPAAPGEVVFAQRYQQLNATLGGVIESCDISVTDVDGDGTYEGSINVEQDCLVTDEEIGLILSTTAAHHFNFVLPNLSAGDHQVVVRAEALSSAHFENGTYTIYNDDGSTEEVQTTDNKAQAWVAVGKGSLTVQEVRAINQQIDGAGIVIDLDK
jgi:hypothetical protein